MIKYRKKKKKPYFLSHLSHLDSEKIINRFHPDKNRKLHDPHQDWHLSMIRKGKECILQWRSRAWWPSRVWTHRNRRVTRALAMLVQQHRGCGHWRVEGTPRLWPLQLYTQSPAPPADAPHRVHEAGSWIPPLSPWLLWKADFRPTKWRVNKEVPTWVHAPSIPHIHGYVSRGLCF